MRLDEWEEKEKGMRNAATWEEKEQKKEKVCATRPDKRIKKGKEGRERKKGMRSAAIWNGKDEKEIRSAAG